MLLTELILSKRGPLAKVWLSAHHEKKLSKQQALGVDVEESVDAILTQEEGPITLRLSGQLMLGVTRIYSRKVQYLLDDCKETRERISLAFRPGVVDLPEDQSRANPNAITFADLPNDFNFFDWTWAAPPPELASTQVNLRPATKEFGAYNFGRPTAPSIYGRSSTSRHPSQDGDSSSHLDSQDFSGIDLGLDFGDISVEKGRDASVQPAREFSLVPSKRGDSVMPDTDMTFGDVDLGLDFGDYNDFNDMPNDLPVLARSRRETSALSTPPPHSPLEAEVTPRTAKRAAAGPEPKAKRARLLYADAELELPDEDFLPPGENTNLLTEERYIPSDPELIRLRAIVSDPISYFLPTVKVGNENMIYAGPQDLAPELTELFTFPTNILRRDKQVEDVEAGRRGSMAPPPVDFGNDAFGFDQGGFDQGGFDQDQGLDQTFDAGFDQGMDMGFDQGFNQGLDLTSTPRKERQESVPRAQSVITVVQPDSDADYPLAMFDPRSETQMTQSESQNLRSEDSGYSKNTGMAMGLLRKEIDAIEGASFDLLSQKATKKAASAFFFELLVLGTRDAVKLDQARPFEDIKIQSKPRLFV